MKNLVLCALVFVLAVGRFSAATTATTGSVSGRIQNVATGQSLNNARVIVKGTDLVAFTDETGTYRLTQVPTGLATLEVFYTGRRHRP